MSGQFLVPKYDTGTDKIFIGDGDDYYNLLNPDESQAVRDNLLCVAGPVAKIDFVENPVIPTTERTFYWDAEYKTLALNTGVPGVTLQIGQEQYVLGTNSTGITLNAGEIVYISGSGGEHPDVSKAISSNYDQAHSTIGMLTNSPLNGEHCMVTVAGLVHSLNTSTAVVGTAVYLSAITAGAFTTTKPSTANTTVRIGWIVKQHATDGEIFVSPQIEMSSAGLSIDAQLRTTTTELPTTPTVFIWPTEIVDSLGSYDPTTGILTLGFSGNYNFNFLYNCQTSGSAKQLYSAAQVWNGSTWVISEFSTRQLSIAQGIKNLATFVSSNPFSAGTQLRFVTWASASGVNIVTESPYTGYTIPAARLMVTGVKTI